MRRSILSPRFVLMGLLVWWRGLGIVRGRLYQELMLEMRRSIRCNDSEALLEMEMGGEREREHLSLISDLKPWAPFLQWMKHLSLLHYAYSQLSHEN